MADEQFKQCNGKNCYSKGKVEKVARAVMKARNRPVRAYLCNKCFYYHLTSEKKSKLH